MIFLSIPKPGRYKFEQGAFLTFLPPVGSGLDYTMHVDRLEKMGCFKIGSGTIRLPDNVVVDISIYCSGRSSHTTVILNIFKTHNRHVPEFAKDSWRCCMRGDQLEIECGNFERIQRK